ncbi:hypothetical protein PAPYR_11040 [Paratrimastix pyriformis]|uniref:Uncharacterized protein n=1 Tax=Paratrimastix pyriformis TaxID=342808 RepID=A0ABQ8U6F9_9EUKA|nr:hypothetical protein PAPYR_11040 [Paratrimastix pyriformis]
MSKTEEQSGMTMEQMEEAGKIEEKKRDAEAAVAQSEVASKKRREGKRVRVPVRFRKPLDSSSPNYRNLTLAMERDGFAEPLVEGSYPSFEVLIYEDDLDLLNKFCGVKGLDILDHRMEELPESRSATTIVGDFSLELLLKAIRDANPGCFVTGKQVHGKVQDPVMKVFRVLCVVRGPPVWPSVVAGRRPIFAGERSEQFENVPGKTVIVLRPAGCRSVADVMRWFATSGLTAPDQIKLKDRDLDSGRWDGGFVLRIPTDEVGVVCRADVSLSPGWTECFASEVGPRLILRISDIWPPEMPKLLGMWPLILLRPALLGSLVIILSFPGVGLMGAPVDYVAPAYYFAIVYYRARQSGIVAGQTGMVPMPASAQNLRMNGQLWMMTGGDARAGQGVNGQTRTPLTPAAVPAGAGKEGAAELRRLDALGIVNPGVARERVEDNLAKMWQANLTEWYEENPDGDNLKKEENPAVGDNLKKEENPAVGDNLKGHRWATPAGWGTDTNEENPAEGDNLMREGAEENPDCGENLDGGMEDHAGDGNAAQAGNFGGILLWLRWLGLASFLLTCSWDREV